MIADLSLKFSLLRCSLRACAHLLSCFYQSVSLTSIVMFMSLSMYLLLPLLCHCSCLFFFFVFLWSSRCLFPFSFVPFQLFFPLLLLLLPSPSFPSAAVWRCNTGGVSSGQSYPSAQYESGLQQRGQQGEQPGHQPRTLLHTTW